MSMRNVFFGLHIVLLYAYIIESKLKTHVWEYPIGDFRQYYLGYNATFAKNMALLTSVSYCKPPNIRSWNCTPCSFIDRLPIASVFMDPKDNFQGFVSYSIVENLIFVAFRGSMDVRNWIENLTFYKKHAFPAFPTVQIHAGFYETYKSISKELLSAVSNLLKKLPKAKVVVTGHSLGAAVASICAFDFQLIQHIPVHSVWAFGQPRVGNKAFESIYEKEIPLNWRITHWRDIVPHLPPVWLGYRHLTREVFYDKENKMRIFCSKSNSEDPHCSDQCSPFKCNSIADHLYYLNISMGHIYC